MKHLTITYGDHILYDGDVAQFAWSEDDTTLQVTAKQPGTTTPKTSLAELLSKRGDRRKELNGAPQPQPETTP